MLSGCGEVKCTVYWDVTQKIGKWYFVTHFPLFLHRICSFVDFILTVSLMCNVVTPPRTPRPAPDPPLPPPLTMKLKKENICWWKCIWKKGETNKMGGKKKKKKRLFACSSPPFTYPVTGPLYQSFNCFVFFMSPLPHITLTIEMAPMHDHWNLCKFYIKFG